MAGLGPSDMPASVEPLRSRSSVTSAPAAPPEVRKPFRDNPRLILLGIGLLLVALVAMIALADRSAELSPEFLSEVVLYALSAADFTILVVLLFVLARNVVKLLVERRRGLPFARFRAKLVAVLLGLTLIPSIMVLIVGSELIRNSAERWYSAPVDEVLTSASQVASTYYHERQEAVRTQARRLALALSTVDLGEGAVSQVRAIVTPDVREQRVSMVEVYRVVPGRSRLEVAPLVDVASSTLPGGFARAAADRLAARAATGDDDTLSVEPLGDSGELVRAAAVVRRGDEPVGVVVVSDHLTGSLARDARRISAAYEAYKQLGVLKRPLAGVYLSFFVMMALMILISATWMGLYLAKRITRPVQMLAAGARQIGAGQFDHRIERETGDEFGALVDAFNTMAAELAASQRKLERSRLELVRNSQNLENRRRYTETILDRSATGILSIDAGGRIGTINRAASRLLGVDLSVVGQPAADVLGRADLQPLAERWRALTTGPPDQPAQEIALAVDGREVHLAVAATRLPSEEGESEGIVLVLDDVTPLIRAQRVATWRDVARRLAHEIKNPLTPIQLCAERIRRHLVSAPSPTRELVEECTATIVGEVDSLKALVDEFSQFARMPAPTAVPADLNAVLADALKLYNGLLESIEIHPSFDAALPLIRIDAEQIRRVVINLVDNAIEALGGVSRRSSETSSPGIITLATIHDPAQHVVRLVVADNGPGISTADRDKLFMPYYSTKKRGSGLGLAIVRRIIVEHGGTIEVGDNRGAGTRFTIELPC